MSWDHNDPHILEKIKQFALALVKSCLGQRNIAMSTDKEWQCTEAQEATYHCNGGECMVRKVVEIEERFCRCPETHSGAFCQELFVNFSFGSTKLDEKQIAVITVLCLVGLLIIIGVIVFFAVRKLTRNRRGNNDSLPIVSVGHQTETSVTDASTTDTHLISPTTKDKSTNGSASAVKNGTNGRRNTPEKLNIGTKAYYV